jgi:hypothetical protein
VGIAMLVTQQDLDSFHHFALGKLQKGGAESIAELARQWEIAREREEVQEALREATEDLKAGRYRPAEEVSREIERKFNFRSQ